MRVRDLLFPAVGLLFAVPIASATPDEHIVVNVVNDFVYVDLGSRDGVTAGDRVELLGVGSIELDLCGEVICRAPVPTLLKGKVKKGMKVRVAGTTAALPSVSTVIPDVSETPEPSTIEPAPKKKPPAKSASVSPSASSPEPETLARLPYRKGSTAPPGYRLVSKHSDTTTTVGWTILSVSYGFAVLDAALTNDSAKPSAFASDRVISSRWLYLPVFGPWILLGIADEHKCTPTGLTYPTFRCEGRKISDTFLVVDGLAQAVGALTIVVGYLMRDTFYLRNDIKAQVHVAPFVSANVSGLAITGTF